MLNGTEICINCHRKECIGRVSSSVHPVANNGKGAIHRKEKSPNEAIRAANELNTYVSNLSLQEAHEQHAIATDQIISIQQELKKLSEKNPRTPEKLTKPFQQGLKSFETKKSDKRKIYKKEKGLTSNEMISPSTETRTNHSLVKNDERNEKDFGSITTNFECVVENLPNILCYYVTLKFPHSGKHTSSKSFESEMYSLNQFKLFVEHNFKAQKSNRDSTIPLTLSHMKLFLKTTNNDLNQNDCLLSLSLFGTVIKENVSLSIEDNFICMRLPYKEKSVCLEMDEISDTYKQTSLNEVNSLSCRSCGQYLTAPNIPPKTIQKLDKGKLEDMKIKRIFPLPTGNWDEILDYLTCYDGQHQIDFSSKATEAKSHHALENNSVVILHKNDLGGSVNVLAIEGYGEYIMDITDRNDEGKLYLSKSLNVFNSNEDKPVTEETKNESLSRGDKTWEDLLGGATVCCSQCCSILGFASFHNTDTFRLLKHRLSTKYRKENGEKSENAFKDNTCGTFIANEMIRYADSQAIFTFALVNTSSRVQEITNGHLNPDAYFKCIFLKLVSSDTFVAIPSSPQKGNVPSHQSLHFSKALKVIFEERTDFQLSSTEDQNNYFWGGADFCCPPPKKFVENESNQNSKKNNSESTSEKQPSSSVRIFLSDEEWTDILEDLKRRLHYFTKSVTRATVMVKLGQPSLEAKLSLLTC